MCIIRIRLSVDAMIHRRKRKKKDKSRVKK